MTRRVLIGGGVYLSTDSFGKKADQKSRKQKAESRNVLRQPHARDACAEYFCFLLSAFCFQLSCFPARRTRALRVNPIQHPRIRNRLAQVRDSADPGDAALDAHPEAGVGEGAVAADG